MRDANRPVAFDGRADLLGEFGKGLGHGRAALARARSDEERPVPEGRASRRYLSASALITFSVMSILWLAKTTGSCSIRSNFSASAIC